MAATITTEDMMARIDGMFAARAKPVHPGLGVTASPQAFVDHLNDRLAAQGIIGERVEYSVERIDGTVVPAGHGYRYGGAKSALKIAAE